MAEARVAVIGGSGIYEMEGLTDCKAFTVETPFGSPSDEILIGSIEGTRVAFLPRHGKGHRLSPTMIPARANIFALKMLGVEQVISVSAVGSLKENIRPQEFVVPDQIIDRTRNRTSTFFDDGIVAHVGFADPFCPYVSAAILEAGRFEGAKVHAGGVYVVMEGPQFSTRAESNMYRNLGASIIGMTALPEAKLAREAEMCYATLALATDYDCWHASEASVSVEVVVNNFKKMIDTAKKVVRSGITRLPKERHCMCANALQGAIITNPEYMAEARKRKLAPIIGRYFNI